MSVSLILSIIMASIIALLAWLYLNQHRLKIQLFKQKHFLNTFLIVNNYVALLLRFRSSDRRRVMITFLSSFIHT